MTVAVDIRPADLDGDPYPLFEQIRAAGPLAWIPGLRMWYVVDYHFVRTILLDPATFTTAFEHSPVHDTFGVNMLTSDGPEHNRQRRPAQPAFMSRAIEGSLTDAIGRAALALADALATRPQPDLRHDFASRLPIQTMLHAFGMSPGAEGDLRLWYDAFERALANFGGDPAVRERASGCLAQFHDFVQGGIDRARSSGETTTLIGRFVASGQLRDDEIRRNLLVIFFGGISTVEALILNCLWTLFTQDGVRSACREDPATLPQLIEEVMRWRSPVHSATRHATRDVELGGVTIRAGDTVNCMLGAANRDPAVFEEPARFKLARANARQHLGFATGSHSCIGFRLAKAEAAIALGTLFRTWPEITPDGALETPAGFEFHQPRSMRVRLKG
jgi:cytochrome P450